MVKEITYLKEIIKNIVFEHKPEIPLMDFNMGFGMDDMIHVWKYPIIILGVFIPEQYYSVFYQFIIIALLYIQGFVFSKFCFYVKVENKLGVLLGCFTYLFCGFSLFSFSRYLGFIYYLIYFPVCLLGVEKFLRERKITFFSLAIATVFFISWYNGYIITILVVLYSFMRLFPYLLKREFKFFFKTGISLAGLYLLGVLISSFMLFPQIYTFISSCRTSGISNTNIPLAYEMSYYKGIFINFFSSWQVIGSEMFVGFLPVSLISVAILFIKKQKETIILKAGFLICLLFACVPFAGKVFNGGGYVTNRWSFSLAFLLAFVTAYMFPFLLQLTQKEQTALLYAVIFFALIYAVYAVKSGNTNVIIMVCLILIQLLASIICFSGLPVNYKEIIMAGTAAWSILIVIMIYFFPMFGNYMDRFLGSDIQRTFDQHYLSEAGKIDDSSFYRVAAPWNETDFSIYYNYNSTSIYNSLLDAKTSNFFEALSMNTERYRFQLAGLDGRNTLHNLFAVKYLAAPKGYGNQLPYNYEIWNEGENGDIYVNKQAAEMVQKHTGYILKHEFDKLSPLERQDALSQGILVDEPVSGLKPVQYQNNYNEIFYTIEGYDGAETDGNLIRINNPNGKIKLSFQGYSNSETYLYLNGLKVIEGSSVNVCFLNSNGHSNRFVLLKDDMQYYVDDDFTINLGYSADCLNECIITFPNPGNFSCESIRLMSYPVEQLNKDMNDPGYMKQFSQSSNTIQCSVNSNEKCLLQFSIPYSDGWTAYLDGEEVKIYNTDIMFMSILADSGEHDIKLVYRTPFLSIGIIVTTLSGIILVLINCFMTKNAAN